MKNITTLFLIFFIGNVIAQEISQEVITARELLAQEKYSEAYKAYERLGRKLNPLDVYYKQVAYQCTKGRNTNIKSFMEYYEKSTYKHKDYWLGMVYLKKYEFEKASAILSKYIDSKPGRTYLTKSKKHMASIARATEAFDNPGNYEIFTIEGGINTELAEFSPTFLPSKNQLIYCILDNNDEVHFYSTVKSGHEWSQPKLLGFFDGFDPSKLGFKIEIATTNDGEEAFVYNAGKKRGLYSIKVEGDNWSDPDPFETAFDGKSDRSDFFISDDKHTILFSEYVDGKGLDIFESYYDEFTNTWSNPTPIQGINTMDNEDSPFLSHDSKTLYFSSDRNGGLGGYDVYKAEYDVVALKGKNVKNLGYPVNTPDNDLNFTINLDNKMGYMSSNRLSSKGQYDVYEFEIKDKIEVSGKVIDVAYQAVPDVTVEFHPKYYQEERFIATSDQTGKYIITVYADEEYVVKLKKGDVLLGEQKIKVPTYSMTSGDFYLKKPSPKSSGLNAKKSVVTSKR